MFIYYIENLFHLLIGVQIDEVLSLTKVQMIVILNGYGFNTSWLRVERQICPNDNQKEMFTF